MSVAGGAARSFTHDAAGNITYDNRTGGGYGYTYNDAGRMVAFAINGVVQAEYTYNAEGMQAIRDLVQAGQRIHNVHGRDGNRLAEFDYDTLTQTPTLLREYIWMDGRAVAVIEGGQLYLIRTDHIARPVFATDTSGTVVWTASYLPFGGVHVTTGTPVALRFPGQCFQAESGLHQNWMRDYDPTTGRYIQADPLGLVDGASVYGYALQNPGRYTYPRGEFAQAAAACFTPAGAIVCGGGLLIAWLLICDAVLDDIEIWEGFLPPSGLSNNNHPLPPSPVPDYGPSPTPYPDLLPPIVTNDPANTKEPPRPPGIPDDFEWQGPSNDGTGNVYVDPANPKGNIIRTSHGNPNASHPSQRGPYAKVTKGGRVVDLNGNPVPGARPSATPSAHIPLSKLPGLF